MVVVVGHSLLFAVSFLSQDQTYTMTQTTFDILFHYTTTSDLPGSPYPDEQ